MNKTIHKTQLVKSIEIWRLLFSFSVVLCHAAILSSKPEDFLVTTLGVEFFFIVSGYLMAMSVWKKDACQFVGEETWKYLWGKLKVIFPVYLFAASLEILQSYLLRTNFDPSFVPYYIFDFLFLRAAGWRKVSTQALVGASWYLSAYFISILILYPFLRKNKDFFLHVTAPVIVILGCGWFSICHGTINFSLELDYDRGFCYGLLRGISEMSLGCVCFALVEKIKNKCNTSKCVLIQTMFTVTEIGSMLAVFYIMTHVPRGNSDFVALLILSLGIISAFSEQSYTVDWLRKVDVQWVSGFSLSLYLNHYCWYRTFNNRWPEFPFHKTVIIVVVLSIINAVVCLAVIKNIKQAVRKVKIF